MSSGTYVVFLKMYYLYKFNKFLSYHIGSKLGAIKNCYLIDVLIYRGYAVYIYIHQRKRAKFIEESKIKEKNKKGHIS